MRVLAQVFPVDTASQIMVNSLLVDLVAWGLAFISVGLVLYAYHRIMSLMDLRAAEREWEARGLYD